MAHHTGSINRSLLGRRKFLRHSLRGAAGLSFLYAAAGCRRSTAALLPPPDKASEEPGGLAPVAALSAWGEAGAPLVVRGRIYAADGKTPAEGVTLHVYHTDARGLYSEHDGNGQEPQPRIKGSVRTGRDGAYEFRTTRPGAYPGRRNPQHIHAKVYGPEYPERWIDEYWFDDDPLVTASARERFKDHGPFSPILKLTRDRDGVFRAVRDIRL
jgi:protocatechuate 3,4-dioxygenase, beta subunit